MTNLTSSRLQIALSLLVALAAAGPAAAQTATSTYSVSSSGTVGTASRTTGVAPDGTPIPAPEAISCTGTVKVSSMAASDAVLGPQVVVWLDTTALSCVGVTTKTTYLNSGQGNLTRPLVATDVLKMTFALYPNTAGGYLKARTGMVTANLTFNTTTGALTAASASIGSFQ
jgi:hypothetical protein